MIKFEDLSIINIEEFTRLILITYNAEKPWESN